MKNFLDKFRRSWIRLNCLLIADGHKKAIFLKRQGIFHHIGKNVSIKTNKLPAEPFLVSIHNNVRLAADVRLVTHSLTSEVFNKMLGCNDFYCQYGKIEIHDNVFVGAGAIIMFGVTIGSNCIVAAGSIVTKNILSGSVVAGIPAKVIGSFEESMKKSEEFSKKYRGKMKGNTVAEMLTIQPIDFDIDEKL